LRQRLEIFTVLLLSRTCAFLFFFFFQAEDGIRDLTVTGVQTCALPISVGELIPSSLRELIRSQLARLTPSAWALLVAGAVLGKGLTFERLCQVAQIDEQAGLYALEELLRSGLLCEGKLAQDAQAFDEYTFPREVIREVVYQEAGATRQRLVQRRVSAVMPELFLTRAEENSWKKKKGN